MKLEIRKCPCGDCDKWNAWPMFASQDTTLRKEEAEELVARWNAFEGSIWKGIWQILWRQR